MSKDPLDAANPPLDELEGPLGVARNSRRDIVLDDRGEPVRALAPWQDRVRVESAQSRDACGEQIVCAQPEPVEGWVSCACGADWFVWRGRGEREAALLETGEEIEAAPACVIEPDDDAHVSILVGEIMGGGAFEASPARFLAAMGELRELECERRKEGRSLPPYAAMALGEVLRAFGAWVLDHPARAAVLLAEKPKQETAEEAHRLEVALEVEALRAGGDGIQKAAGKVSKRLLGDASLEEKPERKGQGRSGSNVRRIYDEVAGEPAPRLPKLPLEVEAPRGKANGRARLRAALGLRGPRKRGE